MNFDPLAGLDRVAAVARIVVGACAAMVGMRYAGLAAELAWAGAFVVACTGYGIAFERAVRSRASGIQTVLAGMAVLLLLSTVLGALGVATRSLQLGAIAVGILANAIPRATGTRAEHAALSSYVVVALVGVALVAVPLVLRETSIEDGFDHTFTIARLWETGRLFPIFHQAGTSVLGEAYVSLGPGAEAAQVFELGLAPALVGWLLASELGAGRDPWRTSAFAILAIPVALLAPFNPEWSGTLFHVAAFAALRGARAHAILFAVLLATVRHEYVVIAVPYIVAAIARPDATRRQWAIAGGAWVVALVPYQIALAVTPLRAVVNAVIVVGTGAAIAGILGSLARTRMREPLAVTLFATASWSVAVLVEAIRPAQHGSSSLYTAGFGLAAALAIALVHTDVALRRTRIGITAAGLAIFGGLVLLPSMMDYEYRVALDKRWRRAIVEWKTDRALGHSQAPLLLRELQSAAPAKARIGFWGTSAGHLDFQRYRMRDISWPPGPRRSRYFLVPLTDKSLRGLDYVLVENVKAQPTLDAWDTERPATTFVAESLELIQANAAGQLFRVRR